MRRRRCSLSTGRRTSRTRCGCGTTARTRRTTSRCGCGAGRGRVRRGDAAARQRQLLDHGARCSVQPRHARPGGGADDRRLGTGLTDRDVRQLATGTGGGKDTNAANNTDDASTLVTAPVTPPTTTAEASGCEAEAEAEAEAGGEHLPGAEGDAGAGEGERQGPAGGREGDQVADAGCRVWRCGSPRRARQGRAGRTGRVLRGSASGRARRGSCSSGSRA